MGMAMTHSFFTMGANIVKTASVFPGKSRSIGSLMMGFR
jgi:hypothetical protein